MLEALSDGYLKAAQSWAEEKGLPWIDANTEHGLRDLQHTFRSKDEDTSKMLISDIDCSSVTDTLAKFQANGRAQSATFKYWDNFLDVAHIMLRLLRAERDADFLLHLEAVCETIPYLTVGGRNNYAKYTPVYVAEMKQLETDEPDAYRHLCNGGFVVRRSHKHLFNAVSTDQALEQTVNREAKSQGGVIGFTLRKGALLRWLMTRHVTGAYSEALKQMCTQPSTTDIHEDLSKARLARDVSDVNKVVDALTTQYQNPFALDTVPSTLVNIISGQVASKEIEDGLTTMKDAGKLKMTEFVKKRLVEGSKSFWDPQSRTTVKTFADMRKPLPAGKQKTLACSTEVLFRRLLSVSKTRDINLKTVLEHELAAVPPALFNDDGSIRKTNKAELAKKLESTCEEVHCLPTDANQADNTAYLIDGMAMLQSLNESFFKTFDDLSRQVLQKTLKLLDDEDLGIDCIAIVFDRYDKADSIKTMECQRRGAGEAMASHQITGPRDVPHYRNFLKGSANKAALAEFVCESITSKAPSRIQQNKSIVLAGGFADGQIVKSVTNTGVRIMQHLSSSQEEADTRLLLHAMDMSATHSRVVVHCDDTDVLVILLYYYSRGLLPAEVYMHAGHSGKAVTRERYIPVHEIAKSLDDKVCLCLPAIHALTGCDSTSALFRVGKRTAYTKLVENVDAIQELSKFGLSSPLESALCAARTFVLLLYGKPGKRCNTLDELRHLLASTTDKDAAMLPPTEDAFRQHVLRARLQTSIWCHSHVPNPELDGPVGHGWTRALDGSLEYKMYEKECAPAEVRDITHLICNDKDCKVTRKCPCLLAGLPCIESCSCKACPNAPILPCEESDDSGSEMED